MTVFVVAYKGTDTDDIIGVYTDIEKAKEVLYRDYISVKFGYIPNIKEIEDNHIYIAREHEWFDEWYITEVELDKVKEY